MHARLSRFAGLDPDRIDATVREFQEEGLARLEQQPGFRGITVGVDYQGGKAIALALWETEADLSHSEEVAAEVRDQAVVMAGPTRTPIVDHYQVVVRT